LCWSLATRTSSVFSSSIPCVEVCDIRFTAISWPSERTPCGIQVGFNYSPTKMYITSLQPTLWVYDRHLINRTEPPLAEFVAFREVICCRSQRRQVKNKGIDALDVILVNWICCKRAGVKWSAYN
jgi:hypothetical protein